MAVEGPCTFDELCRRERRSYACDHTVDIRGLSFEDAMKRIIRHIDGENNDDACIRKLEERPGQTVEKYYIGKTYVREKAGGVPIDPQDDATYDKGGIANCWAALRHRDYGRDGLVVLTIVTEDSRPGQQNREECTLELQHVLVDHFNAHDPRIANQQPGRGNRDRNSSPAYALFMTYSFKEPRPDGPQEEGGDMPRKNQLEKDEEPEEDKMKEVTEKLSKLKTST